MSRTYRRKNYELEHPRKWGTKIVGYYNRWSSNLSNLEFRAPTDEEFYKEFYYIHNDSHSNAWCPGRGFRNARMVENRMINKHEIGLWKKFPDYEPLTEADPRDCTWDWD
jgi:hypothetical protein